MAKRRAQWLRYLAPNALTAANLCFGLLSLWYAHHGRFALAGWMIIYAVLTDRLDGLVARAVKGTSALGMQLDSFADFLNFGVAPAFLVATYLPTRPDLPFASGSAELALLIVCAVFALAAVFRLARYNISSDDSAPTKMFFGVPTTMAGGLIAIWFLTFYKYDPTAPASSGHRVLGDLHTPVAVWRYLPVAMVVLAYLMVSSLPMSKGGGKAPLRVLTFSFYALLIFGYVCAFAMRYPELLGWMPSVWMIGCLVWGQVSESARALTPPPVFPESEEDDEEGAQAPIPDTVGPPASDLGRPSATETTPSADQKTPSDTSS